MVSRSDANFFLHLHIASLQGKKTSQQFQGFPTKNNAFFCHCTRVTRENRMCTCVCLWHGGGEGDEEMQ